MKTEQEKTKDLPRCPDPDCGGVLHMGCCSMCGMPDPHMVGDDKFLSVTDSGDLVVRLGEMPKYDFLNIEIRPFVADGPKPLVTMILKTNVGWLKND